MTAIMRIAKVRYSLSEILQELNLENIVQLINILCENDTDVDMDMDMDDKEIQKAMMSDIFLTFFTKTMMMNIVFHFKSDVYIFLAKDCGCCNSSNLWLISMPD